MLTQIKRCVRRNLFRTAAHFSLLIILPVLLFNGGCACHTMTVTATPTTPETDYIITSETKLNDIFSLGNLYDTEVPEHPWLQISPFHNLKPGDTFMLSVDIYGGYISHLTEVGFAPADTPRSP